MGERVIVLPGPMASVIEHLSSSLKSTLSYVRVD